MAQRSHVRDERGLIPILGCDRDLPVTAVVIESREDFGVSERVEAIVLSRKRIRIGDRLCVETFLFDS